MSISRIALRYSRPLLSLAEDRGVLSAVKDDMANLKELCKSNRDFVLMLRSPVISNFRKADILKKMFGNRVDPLTGMFLDLVARKNRARYLPEIVDEFIVLYNAKMGRQKATVATAFALDGNMRSSFEKLVEKLTGKKPLLKEEVNTGIIGGYVLKFGDRQLDESIRGQLGRLKLKFQKEMN